MGFLSRNDGKWSAGKIGSAMITLGGAVILIGRYLSGDITDIPELFNSLYILLTGVTLYGVRRAQDKK